VAGVRIGHAQRIGDGALTGTTVVLPGPDGAVAGVDVRGGGPGTRETDALDPRTLVDRVHAVVLSGGSAFGLAAATGVMDALGEAGVGFPVGPPPGRAGASGSTGAWVVPIVPAAVVFDLGRGGDFRARPDAGLGAAALAAAVDGPSPQGVLGAGSGAVVGGLKGGVGTASETVAAGDTVTALCVVNAAGSAVDPRTGALWAAAHLTAADAVPPALPDDRSALLGRLAAAAAPPTLNTTIGVVWTDATLTVAQATKLAAVAHDGLARAIRPAHGMTDGDTFFGLSTTERAAPDLAGLQALLTAAADAVTRAVGNAVLAAESVTTAAGTYRSYRDVVAG
jgi:L-aminopeptidase/D-esterase-like protein